MQAAVEIGAGNTPSVSAFATKNQLMNAFTPDSDGNAVNIGKVAFGKNKNGAAQRWYILGKDTGVTGDNTIIFAASPIAVNQSFEENYSDNKIFKPSYGVYENNPEEVYPNHYGASDLRVALNNMADNTGYFTTAEQGLMNATTVTTNDLKNNVVYNTTDKLYALATDNYGATIIKAGSNNQTALAMDSYWKGEENWLWLRSPRDGINTISLVARTGADVYSSSVNGALDVQPASNLNLAPVLFASAADTSSSASGTIADDSAMTLRLDGKNNETLTSSVVNFNHEKITYRASADITLVVQGRGSVEGVEKDWFYSLTSVSGPQEISAGDIKSSLSLDYIPNFNDCKIWKEITGDDGFIYAVMGRDSKSSVKVFASRDELMSAFTSDSYGGAISTGKLVFGKNGKQWYILGGDSGVEGYNTIIFAADSIAKEQVFSDGWGIDKDYNSDWECTYPSDAAISTVSSGHYGASNLRKALNDMVEDGNTTYFTATEKNLMNYTTVTTNDLKNNVSYTTTDKLYALHGDMNNDKIIRAGSYNQTALYMSSYWKSGRSDTFWLRSPYYTIGGVLAARENLDVNSCNVDSQCSVRPASNLNLASVLFASGAKAASSDSVSEIISLSTPMTLRLDGSNKKNGTAIYDASTGKIAAQKDADVTGTVSLVIQGNFQQSKDWYYSVPVGGTTVVSADQIKDALPYVNVDPDLADCDIWLETTVDNVSYAKMAEPKTFTVHPVNTVAITDMAAPVGGEAFVTEASCSTTGIATTTPAITYTAAGGNGETEVTGNADWNTAYKAKVTLATDIEGNDVYVFDRAVNVTIDGVPLTDSITPDADGTLTVTREFARTARRKIGSVTAPTVPANNTFTTYYGYEGYDADPISGSELGTQATVTFTDSVNPNTETINVTWMIESAGGYDGTLGAENAFGWTIPASALTNYDASGCQGFDSDTGNITGTVMITNKAATPVNIAGTDSSTAYSDATIDVSQYFNIDSHAGTATYSLITGTDGGTGEGTLSGTILIVTKTGTFKIKVETLANGIYAAGERNITLTVDNGTIEYSAADYSGTYDGQAHGIHVNVSNPESTIISYSTDGVNYGSDNPSFTEAGAYTVYYRIMKDNYTTIDGSGTAIINKKPATIAAENQSIVLGNDIDESKYTVSTGGLLTGDSITEITLTPSTTSYTEKGSISISGVKIENSEGADVTGNYDITTVNGILKITNNAGSDDSGDGDSGNPDTTYQITEGAGSSWTHDSDGNITIRGNGDFSKFTGVKVDGNLIDKSNYTAKEGSTVITLKADYLNILTEGTHTVEIIWTDGSAQTSFKVNNTSEDNNRITVPKTGDNSHLSLWITLMLSLMVGVTPLLFVHRKQYDR